jgi:hypothetical protein
VALQSQNQEIDTSLQLPIDLNKFQPCVTLPSPEYTLTFQLQLQPITRPATTTRSQGLPNVTLQLHSLQLLIDLNQFCLT